MAVWSSVHDSVSATACQSGSRSVFGGSQRADIDNPRVHPDRPSYRNVDFEYSPAVGGTDLVLSSSRQQADISYEAPEAQIGRVVPRFWSDLTIATDVQHIVGDVYLDVSVWIYAGRSARINSVSPSRLSMAISSPISFSSRAQFLRVTITGAWSWIATYSLTEPETHTGETAVNSISKYIEVPSRLPFVNR